MLVKMHAFSRSSWCVNAGVVEFDNWITRTDVLLAIKDLGDVKMHAFWKL